MQRAPASFAHRSSSVLHLLGVGQGDVTLDVDLSGLVIRRHVWGALPGLPGTALDRWHRRFFHPTAEASQGPLRICGLPPRRPATALPEACSFPDGLSSLQCLLISSCIPPWYLECNPLAYQLPWFPSLDLISTGLSNSTAK